MPSADMLKKLLDEFADKEAHTREEINVINQQIGELEQRVDSAVARQKSISGDREKILAMKDRYAGRKYLKGVPAAHGDVDAAKLAGANAPEPASPSPVNELADAAAQLFASPPPINIPSKSPSSKRRGAPAPANAPTGWVESAQQCISSDHAGAKIGAASSCFGRC